MNPHDLTHRSTILSLWRIFFGLIALQGLGVLVSYLQTRSETGLLLGFSGIRLAIVAGVLLLTAAAAWLFVGSFLFPIHYHQRAVCWADWLSRPVRWGYLTLLSGILLYFSCYLLTLYPDITEPFTRGFMERLIPIIAWLTGACALTLILMIYLGRARGIPVPGRIPRSFWLFLAYFCAALLAWFWVSRTVLPIASSRVGWNQLGVPVLEGQLVLAWGVGILALLLVDRLSAAGRSNGRLFDLVAVVLLWSCAAVFWQSTPISPNWFVSEKIPPNFAQYPYSDARVYDVAAQSALIGEGFKFFNGIDVRRPLHAAYLTLLHLIAGQEYDRVIFLQVLILSLLPVFVYFNGQIPAQPGFRVRRCSPHHIQGGELDLDRRHDHSLPCEADHGRPADSPDRDDLLLSFNSMAQTGRTAQLSSLGRRRNPRPGDADPPGNRSPRLFASADCQPDAPAKKANFLVG